MNNLKLIFSFVIGVIFLSSCKSYFGDINTDPDNPTTVTPNVVLPQTELRLAYTLGGDVSRFTGINTQHVDGIGRQFAVIGKYGIQPTDIDNLWSNIYSGVLMDNRQMITLSNDGGFNHYVGIGKAIEAYTLMLATDLWGDLPYSEAFQGVELLQPKFDSQEDIYRDVFTLIDEAKAALAKDDGGNPVSGDLIYGGDASKWLLFCNALEARGKLHLATKNGDYAAALAAANLALESSADDALVHFGTASTENSPWYQYIEQRDDCEIGSFYKSLLTGLNDPRDAVYGVDHTVPGHPFFTPDQPVTLISATEMAFIKAECLMHTATPAEAYPFYIEGITLSFAEAGLSDQLASYLGNATVNPAAPADLTMEQIMTQKYIALYTQPEVFNDWRRTNIPALSPIVGDKVPTRLPYAQSEILSNDNTPSPADVTIFSKVWWDQ